MPYFGSLSEKNIATLHPDLQRVLRIAIKVIDFSVICGWRNEEDQTAAVFQKRSKVSWPDSRHNASLQENGELDFTISDAVDIAPFPIKWPDIGKQTTKAYVARMGAFYQLAGVIMAVAHLEGIKLKWGGTFTNFFDGPHFERVVD